MRLTDEQIEILLRGIVPSRVQSRDGMSYVETWDIRAMMNRVFGFCGWSLISTSPTTLVFEHPREVGKDKRPGFYVAYKAELELIVHCADGDARYAGSAIGDAVMPDFKRADAHDMAAKSAESGALKRAATNLGDQFGLSLYKGTNEPVVRRVVGFNPAAVEPEAEPEPKPEPKSRPKAKERPNVEPPQSAATTAEAPSGPGAGGEPSASPPAPTPTEDLALKGLPEDPGGTMRAGEDVDEALKRRMEAVELSMKGFTNRQKVAMNATCRGMGIANWATPDDEHLDQVITIANKIAAGETP